MTTVGGRKFDQFVDDANLVSSSISNDWTLICSRQRSRKCVALSVESRSS